MAQTVTLDTIFQELQALKKEIKFIKSHMADADTIMIKEEAQRFEEGPGDLETGKTHTLDELKKKLHL